VAHCKPSEVRLLSKAAQRPVRGVLHAEVQCSIWVCSMAKQQQRYASICCLLLREPSNSQLQVQRPKQLEFVCCAFCYAASCCSNITAARSL
jgi:hypothetical protein